MAACSCARPTALIYACSGAADVGAIADREARQLSEKGYGDMSCLAGVGGRVSALMERGRNVTAILAIDGCPQACAKNCLEQAGFQATLHLQLGDIGLEKGASPPDDQHIEQAVAHGRLLLGH